MQRFVIECEMVRETEPTFSRTQWVERDRERADRTFERVRQVNRSGNRITVRMLEILGEGYNLIRESVETNYSVLETVT